MGGRQYSTGQHEVLSMVSETNWFLKLVTELVWWYCACVEPPQNIIMDTGLRHGVALHWHKIYSAQRIQNPEFTGCSGAIIYIGMPLVKSHSAKFQSSHALCLPQSWNGSKPTTPAYQNSVINWLSLVLHATYVDVHSLNIRLSCLKDSDFFFFILNHHMHTHALEMIQHNANEPVCVGMCALLPQRAAGLSSSCRLSWSQGWGTEGAGCPCLCQCPLLHTELFFLTNVEEKKKQ